MEKVEEKKTNNHELLVVLANDGFSDVVMQAAVEEGAKGGTIIHGRGTGNKIMEKKYGLAVTPNKEIILILVSTDIKDKVMSAVNKVAGIETDAQSFIFSLPADHVSGLKFDK